MKFIDLAGKKFSRLTVIRVERRVRPGMYLWECQCDCGKKTTVQGMHLRSGNTKSCGCRKAETRRELPLKSATHGKSNTGIYSSYRSMISRCRLASHKNWKLYGGRGIRVCRRWQGRYGFLKFCEDMGDKPPGTSLDRIDNDGPYSPQNCRWATPAQQGRNKRTNRLITWRGQTRCLADWSALLGWNSSKLHKRLNRMSIDRAMKPFEDVLNT